MKKYSALLITMLYCSIKLAFAEPNSPVHMTIRPGQCVTINQGEICYRNIEIKWAAAKPGDFCLFSALQKQALDCWSNKSLGVWHGTVKSNQDIRYLLKQKKSNKILASAELKMAWVFKKNIKIRRTWRMF